MTISINVKVFLMDFAVSCHDMMNMVANIICFGRMEFGDWYYTAVF